MFFIALIKVRKKTLKKTPDFAVPYFLLPKVYSEAFS